MREIAYLAEGSQVVFEAPVAGLYRFAAAYSSGSPVFSAPGQIVDLVNGSAFHMFVVQMAQGAELSHSGAACALVGAREPDEVPPEEP
jgi:hypothetical protein